LDDEGKVKHMTYTYYWGDHNHSWIEYDYKYACK
jgi:hypothetical protein